ncbi:MAG: hypothetical protein ACJATT_004335 [Myxococcota bacterium]|jgi:hypothetical protein
MVNGGRCGCCQREQTCEHVSARIGRSVVLCPARQELTLGLCSERRLWGERDVDECGGTAGNWIERAGSEAHTGG